ncbi:proteasome subunit beta type-4 isoform X1 [Hydra vulgaris]|uniref:proteasome subunit beta type-4 isoform X1 n=1 Tax=Hydra vulgaris TaxID=6087 RepID=UPI0001926EF8|nr:proteasome subunit beta type-4 [Hydra vulgaris]
MAYADNFLPAPGKVDIFRSVFNSASSPMCTSSSSHDARKKTMSPIVTGTSVLAIRFDGGVAIAADMLGSYGSLAKYTRLSRMTEVNPKTVVAASGDYADYQQISEYLERMMIQNDIEDDGHGYTPQSIFSFLRLLMYQKRSKFEPLWNTLVVGGYHNGSSFLGYVDKLGVAYEDNTIATGYGAYIARPLMTKALESNPNMSKAEAVKLLIDCLKVLFYRDARSHNRFEISIITEEGVTMESNMSFETNWEIAHLVKGYE